MYLEKLTDKFKIQEQKTTFQETTLKNSLVTMQNDKINMNNQEQPSSSLINRFSSHLTKPAKTAYNINDKAINPRLIDPSNLNNNFNL